MIGSMVRGVATVLALGAAASSAGAEDDFPIEPEASCVTSSCHDDMGKQEFVHEPASDGKKCVACHVTVVPGRHGFELAAEEEGALCGACHADVAAGEYAHFPVAAGMCSFCHDPHQSDNPNELYYPANSELCFSCHDDQPFADATTHGPVGEGACLKCHDPHASEHYAQLQAEPPDLCFGCHDRTLKDAAGKLLPPPKATFEDAAMKLHVPFELGLCLGCHRPHSSPNYRLLETSYPDTLYEKYAPERYICLDCHDEAAFAEPRTLEETNFRNGNLNLHYRHVVREKGRACKACHHHHGAINDKLIRDQVPFGTRSISILKFELTETGGTCAPMCHREVSYDRFDPVFNNLKVTAREGADATPEELQRAKQEQLEEE